MNETERKKLREKFMKNPIIHTRAEASIDSLEGGVYIIKRYCKQCGLDINKQDEKGSDDKWCKPDNKAYSF
jgi:hypothetical protein